MRFGIPLQSQFIPRSTPCHAVDHVLYITVLPTVFGTVCAAVRAAVGPGSCTDLSPITVIVWVTIDRVTIVRIIAIIVRTPVFRTKSEGRPKRAVIIYDQQSSPRPPVCTQLALLSKSVCRYYSPIAHCAHTENRSTIGSFTSSDRRCIIVFTSPVFRCRNRCTIITTEGHKSSEGKLIIADAESNTIFSGMVFFVNL